jgi:hypothetical protein
MEAETACEKLWPLLMINRVASNPGAMRRFAAPAMKEGRRRAKSSRGKRAISAPDRGLRQPAVQAYPSTETHPDRSLDLGWLINVRV